jgi:hypothetical protein
MGRRIQVAEIITTTTMLQAVVQPRTVEAQLQEDQALSQVQPAAEVLSRVQAAVAHFLLARVAQVALLRAAVRAFQDANFKIKTKTNTESMNAFVFLKFV